MATARKDGAPRRDLAARVEEQSERIASLSRELDTLREELAHRNDELKAATSENERLKGNLADARKATGTGGGAAPAGDAPAADAQGGPDAGAATETKRLTLELEKARENLRVAEESLSLAAPPPDIAALKGELVAVREDAERLAKEVVRLRKEAEAREAALAEARAGSAKGPGADELRKDLTQAREEITRLHRELAENRVTNRAVEAELLALQRASNEMIATQYLDEVLQSILSGVEDGLGYDLAILMVLDRPSGRFFPQARTENALIAGARNDHRIVLDRIRLPLTAPGNALSALLDQRTLSIHDSPEPLFTGAEPAEDAKRLVGYLRDMGQRIFAAVPMVVRGELAGALVCSRPRDSISPRERESLQNFSNQAGMAIENAQLVNDMRRVRDELGRKNDALVTTNEKLLEAERTKEALTSMMVHDMKNPLTSIRGYLELLLDEPAEKLPEELRRHVSISYDSSGRLLDMVRDLLDISKMEDRKLHPASEPVELEKLLKLAHAEQSVIATKSKKTIELDIRPDLPAFKGDSDLIGRVIANLLSNSVKHTPKGAKIRVFAWPAGAHPGSPVDAAVLVGIADDGDGIPKEYHEKIFEKFGTVELRRSGAPKLSTGLGLTFCRMAVEAHGGKLWLESEKGKGATFYFVLPLEPVPRRDSSGPRASPLPAGAGAAGSGKP